LLASAPVATIGLLAKVPLRLAKLFSAACSGSNENEWTRGHARHVLTPRGQDNGINLITRVSELIDPYTNSWDEQLVNQTIWAIHARRIITIPFVYMIDLEVHE
jgi:hypothetical protein